MVKGKMKFRWIGILLAVLLVATYGIGAQSKQEGNKGQLRPDIVNINTLKVFGYLEKPEVLFLHDAHTEALEKKGKDCTACHLPRSNQIPGTFKEAVAGIDALSPMFKRLENTARQEVMDVYHKFCIDCHTEMGSKGEKAGPVTCGECHQAKPKVSSSRQLIGLDSSLHFRHAKAHEKKCERCHHEFDPQNKKLIYVKEKEGTCRYCHLEEGQAVPPYAKDSPQISKLTMKEAAHLDCIDCHRRVKAKKQDAGPVKCSGCHDAEAQQKIKKIKPEEIARTERKQPDAVLVSTGEKAPEEGKLGNVRMSLVAYDHKSHETFNDTCRVCHHASMEKCSKCHTLNGSKEGNFIKLEKAYHLVSSQKSCQGCHDVKQTDTKCAGCHVFMEKQRKSQDASCLKCHEEMKPEVLASVKWNEDNKELAQMLIKNRPAVAGTYADEDIPEKVVIKNMADKYEAVEMPHRKIVKKLVTDMSQNKMAAFFHKDPGTICQGCHHNSPVSKKPARCESCHGKPFDEKQMLRPGLLGAYHQQCMTCHAEMKLEKPVGCTGCHKEKV